MIDQLTYPLCTAQEVKDGFVLVQAWDGAALVNCNACGLDLGIWLKGSEVLPEYVAMLVRHLFTAHRIMHLVNAARGGK